MEGQQQDTPSQKRRKYQRDWKRAHNARDREKLVKAARDRRAKHGDAINRRNRERAAAKRKQERDAAWKTYRENPPSESLPPHEQLRLWFEAQPQFDSVRAFANALDVNRRSVFDWLSGKHPPVGWKRRKLNEITGLECFVSPPVKEKRPKYIKEVRIVAELLKNLVIDCGLTSREIQRLEVSSVEAKRIRLENGQRLAFGSGWHKVNSDLFTRWMSLAQPHKYIFFRHKPVDRSRPATGLWIWRMLNKANVSMCRGQKPRMQHFAGDARRSGTGPRLLEHFSEFHRLSQPQARAVWKELVAKPRQSSTEPMALKIVGTPRKPSGGAPRGKRERTSLQIEMVAAAKIQRLQPKYVYTELLFKGTAARQYTRYYEFCSEYRSEIDSRTKQIATDQAPQIYEAARRMLRRAGSKSTTT